jgi:hypothetical protein
MKAIRSRLLLGTALAVLALGPAQAVTLNVIRYRIAIGPIASRKTLRLHTPGAGFERCEPAKPLTAARDGF